MGSHRRPGGRVSGRACSASPKAPRRRPCCPTDDPVGSSGVASTAPRTAPRTAAAGSHRGSRHIGQTWFRCVPGSALDRGPHEADDGGGQTSWAGFGLIELRIGLGATSVVRCRGAVFRGPGRIRHTGRDRDVAKRRLQVIEPSGIGPGSIAKHLSNTPSGAGLPCPRTLAILGLREKHIRQDHKRVNRVSERHQTCCLTLSRPYGLFYGDDLAYFLPSSANIGRNQVEFCRSRSQMGRTRHDVCRIRAMFGRPMHGHLPTFA